MSENEAPFIRLGEDAQNAPRLNYSIPEATSYVGTSVIAVNIDEELLNAETLSAIRENLEEKKPKRPKPIPADLRLAALSVINRNDRVGRSPTSPSRPRSTSSIRAASSSPRRRACWALPAVSTS